METKVRHAERYIKTGHNKKPHKIINGHEKKHCSKCDMWKVLTDFYKKKAAWDGLSAYCQSCSSTRNQEYYRQRSDKETYRRSRPIKINHKIVEGKETKYCSWCDTWKSLTEFYNKQFEWDSLQPHCKSCLSIRQKERYRAKERVSIRKSSLHIGRVGNRKPHRNIDGNEEKHCTECDQWKILSEFQRRSSSWDGYHPWCKSCAQKHDNRSKKKHYHITRKRRKTYFKQYAASGKRKEMVNAQYRQLRDRVLAHYGNQCVRCGMIDKRTLCLDHVYGDGAEERKDKKISGSGLFRRMIKEDFPHRYQILCFNCNVIKMYENKEMPGWKSREEMTVWGAG